MIGRFPVLDFVVRLTELQGPASWATSRKRWRFLVRECNQGLVVRCKGESTSPDALVELAKPVDDCQRFFPDLTVLRWDLLSVWTHWALTAVFVAMKNTNALHYKLNQDAAKDHSGPGRLSLTCP